jgi:hypothetical protein
VDGVKGVDAGVFNYDFKRFGGFDEPVVKL